MKRKILGLILAAVMITTMIPVGVVTATSVPETGTSQYPYLASSYEELKELVYYAEADHSSAQRHIKLVCDIYQEDITNLNGISPSFYADIVLDLAGHSITRKSNVTTDYGVIMMMAGKLTIKDSVGTGSVVSEGIINAALYMASGATLIINGGTFVGVSNAILTQGGTLVINNGDFKNSDKGWSTVNTENNTDLIINGGRFHLTENPEFPETNHAMYLVHTGDTMINGGSFEGGIMLYPSKSICEHVSSSIVKINGVDTDISQKTGNVLGHATDLVEVSSESLISFKSINPAPDSAQKESGYSYMGQFLLGSDGTNINFSAFPNALDEKFTQMGWTVGRDITVYRQNVECYYRDYAANEAFGWNLKDNISASGTYKIVCRIYAEYSGVVVAEKTHTFQIDVFGSSIDIVSVGVVPPMIGAKPNETATLNGSGYTVSYVDWSYYDEEDGEWYIIPEGSVFETGERYLCSLKIVAADGYSFPSDISQMAVYINGAIATVSKTNYNTSRMYVDYEFSVAENVVINDIPIMKGQYLAEGATVATDTVPENIKTGYVYYGEKLYMYNFNEDEATLQFFADSLTIAVTGYCSLGSIYDSSYPIGTDIGVVPGDLTVEFVNGATLNLNGNSYDANATLRVYGDVLFKGQGSFSAMTSGNVYDAAACQLKSLTVDGPRVVFYGANNYAIKGSTVISVISGKLALWGELAAKSGCTIENTELLVGANTLVAIDGCTAWDGATSLSKYKTIWIVVEESNYILGDANLDGLVDSLDYLLVKRHCFKTYTLEGDGFNAANVNGDGDIDSTDYLLVKRIAFGIYKVS